MKTTKINAKLSLRKETLAKLNNENAGKINGGGPTVIIQLDPTWNCPSRNCSGSCKEIKY